MRISYCEDEDFPGQFGLWQANCRRSLQSKAGQAELRKLREALLALPDRRLVHGALISDDGEVCAVGAYARHVGLDLAQFDPEDATDEVGIEGGMPALVAWKVVEMNDIEYHRRFTPEERYEGVLRWVDKQIRTNNQLTVTGQ